MPAVAAALSIFTHTKREQLRQHMQDSGNTRTVIMHEKIARLMLSLSAGTLVEMKHADEGY